MTRKQITLMFVIAVCCCAVIWAGYGDTDDILYQRLDGIGMYAGRYKYPTGPQQTLLHTPKIARWGKVSKPADP